MNNKQLLSKLNQFSNNTLMRTLEIKFIDYDDDYLEASMPVTSRVHQPMGYLHGGATIALAESLGSCLSHISIDAEESNVLGLEVSANHIKSKRDGVVRGRARLTHKGKTTHLVNIEIIDEYENLISAVKMTNIVVPKKK